MLHRIDKVKRQFAHRLFECLAVSVRPLRVEELAEILAVRFGAGALPQLNTGWRLGNAEEAVLSACSSFITVNNVNGSRIVQFAHFSVKEFLTSDRLATASEDLSRYHVVPHLAHATLARASLGVLLHLDDRIDKDSIRHFPLADYAARHWFEHGRFEGVSLTIRDATERLFDREKPHFSAWVWIYDLDDTWRESMPTKHPERPEAAPLYYAIHCRSRWLIEHLIATYPGDIDARGGYYKTSWAAALYIGDIDVACSLLRCGADVNVQDSGGYNPLHRASQDGRADIVRLLLEHNANVDHPSRCRETPLALASSVGHLEISRLLVQEGANVNSRTWNDWTPLNTASANGHLDVVRLLIDNGADVGFPNYEGATPLHSAASNGHLDIVKLLLESGADFNIRNDNTKTPLDLAFDHGNPEVAGFLSHLRPRNPPDTVQPQRKRGEAVEPPDNEQSSLQLKNASAHGQLEIVRSLLDRGSDINEMDSRRTTALHSASFRGKLEVAKLLIERGAYVNSRNQGGSTPLQYATMHGNLEVARFLLDHGADVNARTRYGWTALHTASEEGHLNIALLLVERGADVDVRNASGRTPRQEAMVYGKHKVAEFLSKRDTYI